GRKAGEEEGREEGRRESQEASEEGRQERRKEGQEGPSVDRLPRAEAAGRNASRRFVSSRGVLISFSPPARPRRRGCTSQPAARALETGALERTGTRRPCHGPR